MNAPTKPRRTNRLKKRGKVKKAPKRKKLTATKTWLALLPRSTPPLDVMLADLGSPNAVEIAKTLDVTGSTVYRWRKQGEAPRAAMLALFYATKWGRSQVHAQAHNDAVLQAHIARNLLERLDAAERKLAKLGQIGEFGSANDPAEGAPTASGTPLATGVASHEPLAETSSTSPAIRKEIARFAGPTQEEPEEPARLTRAN